jgi:ClpP class serine protease
MFTEKRFTREHKENVENVLTSVNRKINDDIAADRGLSSISWKMVHNHGSLSAQEAKVEKFVDYLTDRDPLDSLMESTASKETRATIESQFSEQTNFDAFTASKMVSFKDYAQIVARRKRIEAKKWKSYKSIKYMAENSTAAKAVLRMVGYQAPYYNMKNNVCSTTTRNDNNRCTLTK